MATLKTTTSIVISREEILKWLVEDGFLRLENGDTYSINTSSGKIIKDNIQKWAYFTLENSN